MKSQEMKLWAEVDLEHSRNVESQSLAILADYFQESGHGKQAEFLRLYINKEASSDSLLQLCNAINWLQIVKQMSMRSQRLFACHAVLLKTIETKSVGSNAIHAAIEKQLGLRQGETEHQEYVSTLRHCYESYRDNAASRSTTLRRQHVGMGWAFLRASGALTMNYPKEKWPAHFYADAMFSAKFSGLEQDELIALAAEHHILGRGIVSPESIVSIYQRVEFDSYLD